MLTSLLQHPVQQRGCRSEDHWREGVPMA
jgi:hypothetical protein